MPDAQPLVGGAPRRPGWGTFWAAVAAVGTLAGAVIPIVLYHGGQGPTTVVSHESSAYPTTTEPPDPTTPAPETTDPPVTDPATTPDDPSSGGGLTYGQEELADRVDDKSLYGCESHSTYISLAAAAINCRASDGGPTVRSPLVLSFASHADMDSWMAEEEASFSLATGAGPCSSAGSYKGVWNQAGTEKGRMACHWTSDSYYRIAWSYDDALVIVVAEDAGAASLYYWWYQDPLGL